MHLSFKAMGGPIRLDQTHHGRPITIISFHLQPSALFVVEVSGGIMLDGAPPQSSPLYD